MRDLFLLDPDVTFLNHGSYGACPAPVFADYQHWQRQLEWQPVAFMDPMHLSGLHAQSRMALAAEVGADADDLVHAVNATQALNVVAGSLPLQPGDEILTTNHEYAALNKTWADICTRTGAVLRRVTVPLPLGSEIAFTETVLAGITPRTKVLFLSHITSPTALVLPIGPAVAEARKRGILTVIDGAHAPGQINLDLAALGADYYAGNCHKWLMSPKGAAFLHVRRERQPGTRPLAVSHGWTADMADPGPFGNSAFLDRMQIQGTRDMAAWFSVPAAIRFRHDHHWPDLISGCTQLAQATGGRIGRLSGLPPLSTPEICAPQMVSIPIPETDAPALHTRLLGEFGIEIPVVDWSGRCFVRLSVQGYTTPADCDHLVAALCHVFGWAERG